MNVKGINKRIGEQIRLIRLSKNLSQESLAEELGLSVSTFSNLERGTTEFTVSRLLEVLKILDVDCVSFFSNLESNQFLTFQEPRVDYNRTKNLEDEVRLIKIELQKLQKK